MLKRKNKKISSAALKKSNSFHVSVLSVASSSLKCDTVSEALLHVTSFCLIADSAVPVWARPDSDVSVGPLLILADAALFDKTYSTYLNLSAMVF